MKEIRTTLDTRLSGSLNRKVTLTVDQLLTAGLVTLVSGLAIGHFATAETAKSEAHRDRAFREANREQRAEDFVPAYNRLVYVLGEEAPAPVTQEWLDAHNHRMDGAINHLRGVATRSDEPTYEQRDSQ